MTDQLLLGVDLGTGGCKVTVIDLNGSLIAETSVEYPTFYPHTGWSEQDPADWFAALTKALGILRQSLDLSRIAAVAFDGSTHNAVLLDADYKPLRQTIMWTDQRSVAECEELSRDYGDLIFNTAYQSPTPTWTLPQLRWLTKHESQVMKQTRHILFVKDYIRYLITGVPIVDHIEAQGTLFYDMTKRDWSAQLAELAGINSREILPELCNPTDVVGNVTTQAAEILGLTAGIPVICGASDSAVEDYGAGAIHPGDAIVKLATAGNVNVMTDAPYPHRKTLTYSHVVPGMWYSVSATNAAAVCQRWFRDILGAGAYQEMEQLALKSPARANGVVFHPYLRGERCPHWDSKLRGSFVGLGMETSRGDFIRALLEGVAYSLRDCRGLIDQLGLSMQRIFLIGGGARSQLWSEIVANVMNVPVERPRPGDASFGAALLAGVGAGFFADERAAVEQCLKLEAPIQPQTELVEIYNTGFAEYQEIHQALAPVYHKR